MGYPVFGLNLNNFILIYMSCYSKVEIRFAAWTWRLKIPADHRAAVAGHLQGESSSVDFEQRQLDTHLCHRGHVTHEYQGQLRTTADLQRGRK